jgi:hypothetical protein
MEWNPPFDLDKSRKESEKRTIDSLVPPLRNLQAQVSQRGPYGKSEEIYVKKGDSMMIKYMATDNGFDIELFSSEPNLSQTGVIRDLPAEEFVKYLTIKDAKSIARKYGISLG